MTNVEIKQYKDNEWETIARIGSIVTIQKVDEPNMIDAGITPGMEGVVVNFETINLVRFGKTRPMLEVFINEKHVSYFFRPDQIEVKRL